MANYKELIVWQKAISLTEMIYLLVKQLPDNENYALSDQMRRAAVSIASNIAEGHARESIAEFSHFLSIAQGSRAELETQLIICERLNYISQDQARKALTYCSEIEKMIRSLMASLKDR